MLLAPVFLCAQQTLTGLWIGMVSNDSSTVRKEQSFELALSEYRGKVTGYSRSEFIVNDTLYYIVKRVKGKIEGDVCEVTDDEILAYNFPGRLEKGIKVTSTFYRNREDSSWKLAGGWKTNQTKRYYAITGKVSLSEEKDLTASRLFPHLEELGVASKIDFYRERKKVETAMRTVQSEERLFSSIRNEKQKPIQPLLIVQPGEQVRVDTVDVTYRKPIRVDADTARASTVGIPVKTDSSPLLTQVRSDAPREKTSIQPQRVNTTPAGNIEAPKSVAAVSDVGVKPTGITVSNALPLKPNNSTVNNQKPLSTQEPATPNTAPGNRTQPNRQLPTTATKKQEIIPDTSTAGTVRTDSRTVQQKPVRAEKSLEEIVAPAKTIGGRTSEFAQTVYFKSDSLMLALYDNGEIDGDTVSVYMNGTALLSKQGLRASAIRKTIYLFAPGTDEFTLVLFAENLGKYPPNTGLLVVRDGDEVYNVRFSADYQKNAGVVFRRQR